MLRFSCGGKRFSARISQLADHLATSPAGDLAVKLTRNVVRSFGRSVLRCIDAAFTLDACFFLRAGRTELRLLDWPVRHSAPSEGHSYAQGCGFRHAHERGPMELIVRDFVHSEGYFKYLISVFGR